MAGGWIAQGPDTPVPAGADVQDPWKPVGPDTSSVPALVRPHQDPTAHPVDTTRGLFTQAKDLLFGHEPDDVQDSDQAHVAGILPAVGSAIAGDAGAVKDYLTDRAFSGPDTSTLAKAFPKLLGAQVDKLQAGYQETVGANQVQTAERQVAALNVLPQVAARVFGAGSAGPSDGVPGVDLGADAGNAAKLEQMAKDPLVAKTARSLGISPQEFASDWKQYADQSPEQQADAMARAKDTLAKGQQNVVAGKATRNQAWADERIWQPTDLANGPLDPWSLKGLAFNGALAIPDLALTAGATLAGTAVGGPGVGMAAGGATAAALFAPAQREDAKDKIDDQVSALLQKADDVDRQAPIGQKRGLNAASQQLRQQAADLAANSDKIANTAGLLYAVSDAAGAVPVSAVLSRAPVGKAMLDRMVGATVSQTLGGRIAGNMVANGAGGMLQASIQKAVDAGIVHENTSLSDALKDIAYTGVTSAVTAAPIAFAHEALHGSPPRDTSSKDFMDRVRATTADYSSSIPAGLLGETKPASGATESPSGATNGPTPETNGPAGGTGATGAGAARQAYQTKVDTLNAAAAAAEKRSDVTLEPEEKGWSVHVKGQPVAKFDTVEAAREAVAQARKVVGTKPAAAQTAPDVAPMPAEGATKAPERATTAPNAVQTPPVDTETVKHGPPADADNPLEQTQPIQVERRSGSSLRGRFESMTPEQKFAAVYSHDLTGIPNKRAWDEDDKMPAASSIDVDGLGAVNKFGHNAGDAYLKAVATALQDEASKIHPDGDKVASVYHKSGDEFIAQAKDPQRLATMIDAAKQRLAGAQLEFTHPDGRKLTLNGIDFSHAIAGTYDEADKQLDTVKGEREAQGIRSPKGQLPPGAHIAAAESGLPVEQSHPAAQELAGSGGATGKQTQVLGQTVKPPQKPTVAQAQAGNYFKPTVQWHGLPIKVENIKGQSRPYIDAKTGKPGRKVMKADYGYIHGSTGADEDGVDVMMGPHHEAPNAYVIDQLDHTGKSFDEHKIQVGVRSEAEARAQYLSHYPAGWKGLGGITELDPAQLKAWLKKGDLTQPIDSASVRTAKVSRSQAPDARHDSILEYLARHPRGLDSEEASSQGIDKADMGLPAAKVGIRRAFRKNGMTFDEAAEHLSEGGYPVTDAQGHYSPNVLLDRIDDELRGRKRYSSHNEAQLPQADQAPDWRKPLSDGELAQLSLEDTRNRIAQLQAEQERLEREIERAGLSEDSDHETEEELDRIPFQRSTRPPGVQMDLFGAVNNVKNEIKKAEAALDEKRNSGQESVETGKPDDLFSQSRQQVDLTDTPAIAPSGQGGALDDAGQKIGGARKDRWAERGLRLSDMNAMTEGEAAELVNKKAVWNPDWQKLIAGNMDPKTAALSKILFDQLAARPRLNTPDGRRHYVEVLGRVRDMLLAAKKPDDLAGLQLRLANELGMPTGYAIASTPEQQLARAKFWSIQKGRRSTLAVAHSDLRKADELLSKGWPAKVPREAPTGTKPKDDKELPVRPHLDHIDRVGPPVRRGDVASTDFVKDFGFRGLEFGNWAASDERQKLLNYAYEGLHDLARAVGLPPQALSLNGTLGLALGARGGGRGAAHYESGKMVINMTKTNGAGALAHEWGHALDHYMGEVGRPDAYTVGPRGATGWRGDRRSLAHLRPELQEAWNGVMEAMYKKQQPAAEFIRDREQQLERTQTLHDAETDSARKAWYAKRIEADKQSIAELRADPRASYSAGPSAYLRESSRLGDYWRRPTEMFARAFEGFVQDKIAAEGNKSEYLVHHAHGLGYPGEDRPQVNAAIQKLVDTFETQGDKSALFQRTEPPPKGWGEVFHHLPVTMTPDEIRGHVGKMLKQFAVQPDVVVAHDLAELKRDPALRSALEDAHDGDVIAFVHQGKIYLVANQFHGLSDVASAFAHEYITHYGLRAAFGDRRNAQYQAILDGVARAMPAELRGRGEREFPTGFNAMNAHQRNVAAEEVLAYYGQRYAQDQSAPAQLKRWLDKLHGMIRDWLRSVMGLPKKFDELFIKRTLADLESYLRRGRTAQGESLREAPAFAGHEDTFFSALAKAVDAAKREKGTGAEWEATLRNMPGVKSEELQWTGIKDWLEGRGRVTKQEVADYVSAHRVQLGEVHLADAKDQDAINDALGAYGYRMSTDTFDGIGEAVYLDRNDEAHAFEDLPPAVQMVIHDNTEGMQPPKYKSWATPGGENYREMLMTLPESKEVEGYRAAVKANEAAIARNDTNFNLTRRYLLDVLQPITHEGLRSLNSYLGTASDPAKPESAKRARKFLGEMVGKVSTTFRTEARELMDKAIEHQKQLRTLYAKKEELAASRLTRPSFHSGHWKEPNILAHVRYDDRTGPNGEKVLHVHEVQSDWHQAGRREGYHTPPTPKERAHLERKLAEADVESNRLMRAGLNDDANWHTLQVERQTIKQELAGRNGVPDAPFKTTWPELAMKRMLRMAAEGGYDHLTWDTGETNAERYNMAQSVDNITVTPGHKDDAGNQMYRVKGIQGNTTHLDDWMTDEKMAQYIGKDMAQRAISDINSGKERAVFDGNDLKVGGAGMRGFYDDILPKIMQKLVKKWGGSVERTVFAGRQPDMSLTGWESTEGRGGVPDVPAYMVRITPAMRDSVMQGQPMFLKRRKGSTGTPAPTPKKGAYELARRAIAAIPNSEFAMSFRRIADPSTVSQEAHATALVTREALGELAQSSEEALQNLERFSKTFDLLATQDRYDFIDAMETGSKQPHQELQPAADAIRKILDDWRERIRGLGTGALDNFIENYFPHIWADDAKAKKVFGQIFGRRPLKGPATFLKERTIPTTKEGLAAGLKPISTNPLILAFAKLREMQRFYTGVKLMQRFKDEELAQFLPSHKLMPEGWAEINDAVGRVRQWSDVEQGFIERGKYIMPVDAARVINNHLGASALRNFLPAQIFRTMSNSANALQLGFSAFHLGFTTLDAVISKNALAIERLMHGEPLKASMALLEASTGVGGAAMNMLRGAKLMRAYSNIGGATPEMRRIVEGLMAGGGRVKMDNYYQAAQGLSPFKGVGFSTLAHDVKMALTQPHNKVWEATKILTSFPQQYATRLWRDLVDMTHTLSWPWLSVPLEVAGRMTRASTSIIMEHIVPLQKLGVFSDLAADHIRRNPLEDPVAFAGAMQSIWNSVDNRLGEMVYDNVFWNRTFKEINHMMVRAVGWNLGTVRELGGAPIDMVKVLDYLARGAPPEGQAPNLTKGAQDRQDYETQKRILQRVAEKVGHKIPYTLALIGTTMILGAILTRLFTGKSPQDIKDYFFPPTGRDTKYGTPERISMPSYTKDMLEYATQPMGTIINKANPLFGIIHSLYADEDFFGSPVYDPQNPDGWNWKNLRDGAAYAMREVQPFSLQGTKQFVAGGDLDAKGKILSTMPYVGFGPAPARVTSPDVMDHYQHDRKEKAWTQALRRQLKQAQERGDQPQIDKLQQELLQSRRDEKEASRQIRQDKIKARDAAQKISSLIEGKSRTDAAAALTEAGLPAFSALWSSMPEHPRPRVVASLEGFA